MSVLKGIEILNKKDHRVVLLLPDQKHTYWDVWSRNTKNNEQTVYYQMRLTTVLDMIYRAGCQGHEVKLKYEGGDNVEL